MGARRGGTNEEKKLGSVAERRKHEYEVGNHCSLNQADVPARDNDTSTAFGHVDASMGAKAGRVTTNAIRLDTILGSMREHETLALPVAVGLPGKDKRRRQKKHTPSHNYSIATLHRRVFCGPSPRRSVSQGMRRRDRRGVSGCRA